MRRTNGRCSLSGLVWPSPDSTSSHLQISAGVRIQQATASSRSSRHHFPRQERDFLPQRLRSEIGRVPSGERETRRTHWKSPPLVGIFGASPHVGRKREYVVVDAAPIEPVSLPAFLGNAGRFSQNAGRRTSQSC